MVLYFSYFITISTRRARATADNTDTGADRAGRGVRDEPVVIQARRTGRRAGPGTGPVSRGRPGHLVSRSRVRRWCTRRADIGGFGWQ